MKLTYMSSLDASFPLSSVPSPYLKRTEITGCIYYTHNTQHTTHNGTDLGLAHSIHTAVPTAYSWVLWCYAVYWYSTCASFDLHADNDEEKLKPTFVGIIGRAAGWYLYDGCSQKSDRLRHWWCKSSGLSTSTTFLCGDNAMQNFIATGSCILGVSL